MSNGLRRDTGDGPFCWGGKETLRRIGEHFAESNKVPSARSVYLALCELASNEQSEQFTAKVATIAKFAGVSPRTVHDVLPELVFIQVVLIKRRTIRGSKMDAPSIYTLTRCDDCVPLGNNCIPLCNGSEQTSVAENLKNLEKNTEKKGREESLSSPMAPSLKVSQEVIDSIYREYPRKKQPSTAHRAILKALGIITRRGTAEPVVWLAERVQAYARTCAGQDPRFIPYPATWFNAGSYDEDLSANTKVNGHAHHRSQQPTKATTTRYAF